MFLTKFSIRIKYKKIPFFNLDAAPLILQIAGLSLIIVVSFEIKLD